MYIKKFGSNVTKTIEHPGDVFVLQDMQVAESYGPWTLHSFAASQSTHVLMTDGVNLVPFLQSLPETSEVLQWVRTKFHDIVQHSLDLLTLTPSEKALLCSLVAIACAKGLVVLEQPENGLHPHMIRGLVQAAHSRVNELRGVSVGFISYSPVLLTEFEETPENIWLPRGEKIVRLTDLYDKDWLRNFALGTLYSCDSFEVDGHDDLSS